jgi:hypothetical protein
MGTFPRYFTINEAENLIPHLEVLMNQVQTLKERLDKKAQAWQTVPPQGVAEQAMAQGQVDFMISQINSRLDEVVQLGCLPKDVDQGLVDFPARLNGREINLCWKRGEQHITFWHGLDEGFASRKPFPSH